MEISKRIAKVFQRSRELAKNPPKSTFTYDIHTSALTKFKDLPRWEKQARAKAFAITNQEVYVEPDDKIIGRVYYRNEIKPEKYDTDFDFNTLVKADIKKNDPEYAELVDFQLACYGAPGHIAWDWNTLLRQGTDGMRERCRAGLVRRAGDEEAEHFYRGVIIMLDALDEWNDKHVTKLLEMGKTEEAEICKRVPRYPARSFREALQSFFMQYIVVMKEQPYGGNSPGRLDYYLWPYLEEDIKAGKCTLDEARELCEELFIRIDERLYYNDGWVESVVLGGSYPNGASAVTPLSHIMIEAFMKHNITHPHVYARVPKNPPKEYLKLLSDYIINGGNRAQLIYDESAIKALVKNGVNETDAVDYYCGGCMELGVQGRTSDFLFLGYHSVPKLLELCMTGGYCLINKKNLTYFKTKPLTECCDFEEFYSVFINEAKRVFTRHLDFQDKLSAYVEKARPDYLISSMVDDCIAKGRNMHGGGARYHDYGSSMIGLPNAADSLYAIKVAVFDEKYCTAEELIEALKADFNGYEELRAKLLAIPKYGQENAEVDAMMSRISVDLTSIFASYHNRFDGNGKAVLLTFVWAARVGGLLGATPDGRHAGVPVAHSVTPQSMSMSKGITAAINSCTSIPFEVFGGGASAMWDLDPSLLSNETVSALFMTFFEQGGHIFQGNVTDVEDLKRAKNDPDNNKHIIVRVGGYSARFTNLSPEVQDEIINRFRHSF